MQIIEVLSVETSEGYHATSYKACAVSPSRFGVFLRISFDFQGLDGIVEHVDDQKIVKIIAEATSEDINFIIIHCTRVTPP